MQDEPFHVSQTQKYCDGRYGEWDPKITTFPGLYILGTLVGKIVSKVTISLGKDDKVMLSCFDVTLLPADH